MSKSKTQDSILLSKVPPQAKELEDAVLAAILLEKTAFERVSEFLTSASFYTETNQLIYAAMETLAARNNPIDMLTVVEQLKKDGSLEKIGGVYNIAKLTHNVVSTAHLEAHAKIVKDKHTQRSLIEMSSLVLNMAYSDQDEVGDIIQVVEQHIFNITSGMYQSEYKKLADIIPSMLEEIDKLANNSSDVTGVPSGFYHLDRTTLGWQPGDLVILAARPAVGKTAFTLNLARNSVLRGYPAAYFSLEMTSSKLAKRIASMDGDIPLNLIKSGKGIDSHQLLKTSERMSAMPMYIDDSFSLNITELKAKARRLVNKHGVQIIFIDYLQLMNGRKENNSSREQEISSISRGLKSLAKELNVPIIALSQLSREIEKRQNKMPQLSDLRESGAIEQDADMVMFLWRPDETLREQDADLRTKGMLKIAKFRDGALDDFVFDVNDSVQRWEIIGPLNPYKKPEQTYDQKKSNWRPLTQDDEE